MDQIPQGFYNYTVWEEDYWGISGELLIGLIKGLYGRLEVGELRFYTLPQLGKGQSLHLFSGLDADLIYILPLGKKISPLIYSGITSEEYSNKETTRDVRILSSLFEFRLGLGLNYKFGERRNLFLETQLISHDQYGERLIGSPNVFLSHNIYGIGPKRVNLGIRFFLD